VTLRLLAVFWTVMSAAGLAVQYLFGALGLVPAAHPHQVVMAGIRWNYTTALDIIALIGLAGLYWLYRNRERFGGGAGYAKDPICGMQIQKVEAPATACYAGDTYYFCSEHCEQTMRRAKRGRAVPHPGRAGRAAPHQQPPPNR